MPQTKKISKFLSLILRHKPEVIGVSLDDNGWANIDEIIQKTNTMKLTRESIVSVVQENDKQRFVIDGDKIRANQGHSIDVDLGLISKTPPNILYHGTATQFLDSIMKLGLRKQNRQYVHLSLDIQTASMVGQRHGKLVILEVDTKRMFEEGIKFYCSENGVWLTDSVAIEFLTQKH